MLLTLLFALGAVGDCGSLIPNATCTVFDTTPPIIGTASQTLEADGSYTIRYTDFSDALAGVDTISLWYQTSSETWIFSGLSSSNNSGQFNLKVAGLRAFKLLGLDKATNEVECILNLGDTVKPIIIIEE